MLKGLLVPPVQMPRKGSSEVQRNMQLRYKEPGLHHKLAPEFGNVISVVQMVLVLKMKMQDQENHGEKLRPDSV